MNLLEKGATISVPHGIAVPEGVFHRGTIGLGHIDKGINSAARTVDGVPAKCVFEIIVTFRGVPMRTYCCFVVEGRAARNHQIILE